jgi:Ca-activated chloride channel family protein
MDRRRLGRIRASALTGGLLAAAALGAGALLLRAQDTTFKVDVKLVRIIATVKNSAGQLVGNLGKADFQIFDHGAPQQLAVFEHHTDQPLSVVLMMDTSASTGIDLKYEVDSVNRFLAALFKEGNPQDALSLYTFNWETTLETDFTRRLDRLDRALRGIRSGGGTSLYDALIYGADALDNREGRHVIVVVTDGGDTTSARTFDDALKRAQLADAVIYPILVVPITNDAGRNTGGEHALITLAQRTGGRVFEPTLGPALDEAFTQILQELRTQYLLGYYPKDVPPGKSTFHTLQVKVRPDLQVSARSGYYEDSEQGKGWRPVR